ncbi:MAG TPA: histidine kinase [Vicinamibacterales bacterium]|nr:histidine kinase [Vicinamibacterales bacterium]
MHPILEDRRRLALYLLAWLIVGMLLAAGLRSDASWTTAAAFLLPLCFVYGFIGLSTWYLCRAFPIGEQSSWSTVMVVQSIAAATASAIWTALGYVWADTLDALGLGLGAQAFYTQQRPLLFVIGGLLYWLAVACHYLLVAFQTSRDAETRAFEQTLLARNSELRALRAQIDPHFIFNSLHSISALTTSDAAAARTMCLLLADFLRDTLRLGSHSRISFADEWSLAERFLAIEQVRLGARLTIARDSDPHAADCSVPPLLLQPLVENAVIHGIAQLVEGGTIRMTARRTGPMLTVTVENPCDPDRVRTRGVGLGLDLLRKRLMTEFGVNDAVRAQEQSGRFTVEVRIPVAAPQTT